MGDWRDKSENRKTDVFLILISDWSNPVENYGQDTHLRMTGLSGDPNEFAQNHSLYRAEILKYRGSAIFDAESAVWLFPKIKSIFLTQYFRTLSNRGNRNRDGFTQNVSIQQKRA